LCNKILGGPKFVCDHNPLMLHQKDEQRDKRTDEHHTLAIKGKR